MKIPIEFMGNLAAAGEAVQILVINPCSATGVGLKRPMVPRVVANQASRTRMTNAAALEVSPSVLGVALPADGRTAPADASG